jgi:hypothetical protein
MGTIRSSQASIHQLTRPRIGITNGTSTVRTRVASTNTATARPKRLTTRRLADRTVPELLGASNQWRGSHGNHENQPQGDGQPGPPAAPTSDRHR